MTGDLGRLRPNVVVNMANVVNHSERANGARVELIVLHDTESHNTPGNADLRAIGNWFNTPAAQASAHVAVDGDGNSAVYVDSILKAWHVTHYNSAAVGIEYLNPAPPLRGRMTATAMNPAGAFSADIVSVRWPTEAVVAIAMPSAKQAQGAASLS